jgi:hypothetical protein
MTRALWGRLRFEQVVLYDEEGLDRYRSKRSGWLGSR